MNNAGRGVIMDVLLMAFIVDAVTTTYDTCFVLGR
jgi:hypothetical protein